MSRAQLGAIRKIDNIVEHGAKTHDFEGAARELRGETTGFDHVTEMRNNVRGIRFALASLRGSLGNPNLSAADRAALEAALKKGQDLLNRMQAVLAGHV